MPFVSTLDREVLASFFRFTAARSQRGRASRGLLSLLFGVLVAGCASTGFSSKPAEEIVLSRAQARWDALVARDWATAYKFMVPAYRAIVPQERYGNQFQGPVKWESAKASSAKCEEKRCSVQVEVAFRALLPRQARHVSSTYVEEIWVLEEGQWFKFEPV